MNNFFITRDKYFEMKAKQKAIASERRTHQELNIYQALHTTWSAQEPQKIERFIQKRCDLGHYHSEVNPLYSQYEKDLTAWRLLCPKASRMMIIEAGQDKYARAFNIAYGLMRGRSYKQIESVVRENNAPDWALVQSIAKEYGCENILKEVA